MGSSLFQGWSQDSEKAGSKIRGNWIVSESVEDLIMAYNVQRFRKPCRSVPILCHDRKQIPGTDTTNCGSVSAKFSATIRSAVPCHQRWRSEHAEVN